MLGNKSTIAVSVGLMLVLALSGCEKKASSDEAKPAALVNGEAIPAAQIDAELERIGKIAPEQSQVVANQVLKNVLDQELLAQNAVKTGLDKQADVQMRIAAARRKILAEAQISILAKDVGTPTEADIKAYYDGHPELFAKRSIFRLQELVAGTTPENIKEAEEIAKQSRSAREMAASLQAKGIPVGGREMVKGAEDLPTELLAKLSTMKAGQSITQVQNGKLNMVILADVESRPVTLEQASPAIVRYLANKNKLDLVEAELKKLKAAAKIEYKPPYADISEIDTGKEKP